MAAEAIEFEPDRGGPVPLELRTRPWHLFSGRLHARLDELTDTDLSMMDPVETGETIVELQRAEARLAAIKVQLVARAERLDVAKQANATSPAAWLRSELPLTPRQAKRAVTLGRALDSGRYAATIAALSEGRLMVDQAEVIVAAVDSLPPVLMAEERSRAEAHLVELGRSHDARQLKTLARHLLEVIDPELADQELAKKLEAEEEAASRATSFTMVDDGQGRARGRFTLPSLQGQMFVKLLQGFANPQIPQPIPRTEQRSDAGSAELVVDTSAEACPDQAGESAPLMRRLTCEVMGDALVALIESYPIEKVPSSGGLNATVVVTMPLETVQDGLRRATVAGADVDISATAARRLACAAGVIPAVLDGRGRVLDLGRKSRFASPAQRLAKVIEQQGLCAIEHCDRPASWADAHHWKRRWVDGGRTDLTELILICPRHHTLAHLPGRTVRPGAGNRYRIHFQT